MPGAVFETNHITGNGARAGVDGRLGSDKMVKGQHQTSPEEFEVEKIAGKKVESGRVFYLVKWRGFSESENTWEPVEHMEGSMDLVRQYEREFPSKVAKKASFPASSSAPSQSPRMLEMEEWSESRELNFHKKARKRPQMTLGAFPIDSVKSVIRHYREDGGLKFVVSWKERDGMAPGNSVVGLEELADREPRKLIEFLVESLKIEEGDSESS